MYQEAAHMLRFDVAANDHLRGWGRLGRILARVRLGLGRIRFSGPSGTVRIGDPR